MGISSIRFGCLTLKLWKYFKMGTSILSRYIFGLLTIIHMICCLNYKTQNRSRLSSILCFFSTTHSAFPPPHACVQERSLPNILSYFDTVQNWRRLKILSISILPTTWSIWGWWYHHPETASTRDCTHLKNPEKKYHPGNWSPPKLSLRGI